MTSTDPSPPPAWYLDGTALACLPADPPSVAALVAAVTDHRLAVVTSPEALLETSAPLAQAAPAGVTRILDAFAAMLLPPRHGRTALLRSMDPVAAGEEPELVAVPPTPFPLVPEAASALSELAAAARTLTADLEQRLRANARLRGEIAQGRVAAPALAGALFDSAIGDRERLRTLALLLLDALGVDAEPQVLDAAQRSPALTALLAVELGRLAREIAGAEREPPARTGLRIHHAALASTCAVLLTGDPVLAQACQRAWSSRPAPRVLHVALLPAALART